MNIISSIDCAFSFYQNYPCRLTHTEMECEFPCDELLFASPHPFAEPNFRYTRDTTISDAFQSLFEEYPRSQPSSESPGVGASEPNRLVLRVFDMWILIHRTLSPFPFYQPRNH